jgi:hypothetical protein
MFSSSIVMGVIALSTQKASYDVLYAYASLISVSLWILLIFAVLLSAACFLPILGNLNFLEPSVSLKACNGTELYFYSIMGWDIVLSIGKSYGVSLQGSNPGGDIFYTHPKQPEDKLNPCKIDICFFPASERSKSVVNHPSPFKVRIKKE